MTPEYPAQIRILAARGLIAIFLFCLTAPWWAVPCHAAEPVNWSRYNKWAIKSFQLEGVPKEFNGDIKGGLAVSGKWKILRGQQRPEFSAQMLAEDLARIRLYFAVRGYPAAQAIPTVSPRPESRQLDLVISVIPGPAVHVSEVRFLGWPEGVAVPDTSVHGLVSDGQIFTDEALVIGLVAVQTYLQNAGYALVEVQYDLVPQGAGRVGVDYLIEAGDFYVIDEVVFSGCSDDLLGLARRTVNIEPGTEYAETRLTNAAVDLRLTQLFRQVELVTEEVKPGHLRLKVNLENGKMRNWDASVGTWSDNPWMVRSTWLHRNLFGQGRGFNVRGSFATHELNAGVGVFWLGWLSPRARTRVGVDLIGIDEDAYESQEYRVEIVQSFRPRNRDFLNFGTALSVSNIKEKIPGSSETPEPQGRLWEVWGNRKWDRTDDPIFPTRGGFLKLILTFAEPWVFSEVPYVSGQIDAAKYLDLPLGLTFSTRIRTGLAVPLKSDTEVLANRRFYAGGYNSHRGYERHGLGPRDNENNSQGGETVILASGEIRIPLFWILEGGVFLDSGNVWGSNSDFDLDEYPVAVGATMGFRTPLGPLRFGYAVNVADLVPGQPKELWHFGIGYPW